MRCCASRGSLASALVVYCLSPVHLIMLCIVACLIALGVCGLLVPGPATATTVSPLTLGQTVRASAGGILAGTVLSSSVRQEGLGGRFLYTDYIFGKIEVLSKGRALTSNNPATINLTWYGGVAGNVEIELAGVPRPQVGSRYLLLLHGDARQLGSPLVGLMQGQFELVPDEQGREVLQEHGTGRSLLVVETTGEVVRPKEVQNKLGNARGAESKNRPATLGDFKTWLASPSPSTAVGADLQPETATNEDLFVPESVFQKPETPGETRQATAGPLKTPQKSSTVKPTADLGSSSQSTNNSDDSRAAIQLPAIPQLSRKEFSPTKRYVFKPTHNTFPIVVNPMHSLSAPWSSYDVAAMALWNTYADVFRISEATGTYGWNNGVNDVVGFITNAKMKAIYGLEWGPITLATCITRSVNGVIVEADVLVNAAKKWTLDDETVWDGGAAADFKQTMVHELGHAAGLDHNFNWVATMNYPEDAWRGVPFVFGDDAEGLRRLYPDRTVNFVFDQGAYLFRSNGYQDWEEADFPVSAVAGDEITVSNFLIENVGSSTLIVKLDLYISKYRDWVPNSYYLLDKFDFPTALGRFSYFTPSDVKLTSRVPAETDGGDYYVVLFSADGGSRGTPSLGFPATNSYSWSRSRIQIFPRLGGLNFMMAEQFPTAPSGYQLSATLATIGRCANAAYVSLVSSAPLLVVPAGVTIPKGQSRVEFPVQLGYATQNQVLYLTATYRGVSKTAQITIMAAVNAPTKVTLVNMPIAQRGKSVFLSAFVKLPDGNPVTGVDVSFSINGAIIGNTVTDDQGKAGLAWSVPPAAVLSYRLEVQFAGSAIGAASKGAGTLVVFAPTALTTTALRIRRGQIAQIKVNLKPAGMKNAIVGEWVGFTIGSKSLGRAKTDKTGTAAFAYRIPAAAKVGSVVIVNVAYAGCKAYGKSGGAVRVTVLA